MVRRAGSGNQWVVTAPLFLHSQGENSSLYHLALWVQLLLAFPATCRGQWSITSCYTMVKRAIPLAFTFCQHQWQAATSLLALAHLLHV